MIHIDLELFGNNKVVDIYLDENNTVDDLLIRLEETLGIKNDATVIFSKRRECALTRNIALAMQGIRGGDTLILIEAGGGKGNET